MTFTSAGTSDAEADSHGYSWSFGDGGTATGPAPANDYMAAGTYQAILTVADPFGGVGKDTVVVAVLPGTGFPATAVARLILAGRVRLKGILPPEFLGADETVFRAVMDDLAARRVIHRKTER